MTDLINHIDGRLRALEYMLASIMSDACLRSPDIGVALKTVADFMTDRAKSLVVMAEQAGEPEGLSIAAFAEAMLELRKQVVEMTAMGAASGAEN